MKASENSLAFSLGPVLFQRHSEQVVMNSGTRVSFPSRMAIVTEKRESTIDGLCCSAHMSIG